MTITSAQIRAMARGETNTLVIDWGENTAGQETGVLKAGDTVASCTAAVYAKPPGADDLILGAVSPNATTVYINGRACSAGEATSGNVTTASNQSAGLYVLRYTATTTNGKVLPRFVRVLVLVP